MTRNATCSSSTGPYGINVHPCQRRGWGAAATSYEDQVYVFGGAPNSVAERYQVSKDTWSTLSELPQALRPLSHGLMAVTVHSEIYLFYRNAVYAYDPDRDEYTKKRNPPVPRSWATCAAVDVDGEARIYLIGGYDFHLEDGTNANYYYKPSADRWSSHQAPAPYSAYGVTRDNPVWKNLIYYGFGHTKQPNRFFKYMYTFDPTSNGWLELSIASHERDGISCAILDGRLFVVGGRNHPDDEVAFGLQYNESLTL